MNDCARCGQPVTKRYSVELVQSQFTHKKHYVCWPCLNWIETVYSETLRFSPEFFTDEEKREGVGGSE